MNLTIQNRAQAKAYARILLAEATTASGPPSMGAALEAVAAACGRRDWNTLAAALPETGETPLAVGDRVRGYYLRRPFAGEIIGVENAGPDRARVTVMFDAPVDVVRSDAFSALRRRVRCLLSSGGVSFEKTGDGAPHMVVSCEIAAAGLV